MTGVLRRRQSEHWRLARRQGECRRLAPQARRAPASRAAGKASAGVSRRRQGERRRLALQARRAPASCAAGKASAGVSRAGKASAGVSHCRQGERRHRFRLLHANYKPTGALIRPRHSLAPPNVAPTR
ncbi:hypothetical protein [Cohnella lubricantis]|uniref:Uncharacterized protein n=1 Tax=Cohnella lubricantis TaxID=2163172 RepID=A0A841T7P9_9BACL|nr:hypothetical protein [Cohnella lubricantis]MBB6676932.1 hypothetical protein [Cohnella lubricantis]MBP2118336.1 hypothetical protein [Cohnella lubricantis]